MSRTSQPKQTAKPVPDFSAMPEFARAIRGLARVPKKEVDDAIAKEKMEKKSNRR
jgi:hypothetical protein